MKDWFANLESREQLFVAVGATAAVIVLLWALVWLPLDRGHEGMRTGVATWEQSLAELRAVGATIAASPAGGSAPSAQSDDSPMVVVDQTLRERNLNNAVKRQQPTPNGIRVEFENVAFDNLIVWLGDVQQGHGLVVQAGNFSLSSRTGPGRINASITLERIP